MRNENDYEYELPDSYKDDDDIVSNASKGTNSMLDPNGKNLNTWVIGILLLVSISSISLIIGIYEKISNEKDKKIELLESRDCITELKRSLEVQSLLAEELSRLSESRESTKTKANQLLQE